MQELVEFWHLERLDVGVILNYPSTCLELLVNKLQHQKSCLRIYSNGYANGTGKYQSIWVDYVSVPNTRIEYNFKVNI